MVYPLEENKKSEANNPITKIGRHLALPTSMKIIFLVFVVSGLLVSEVIASRARDKALQTDKFPRPPETVSGTTSSTVQPKPSKSEY